MIQEGIDILILSDYGSKEIMNQKSISIQIINESMSRIDWTKFHQVVLSKNENDWIEVGGNLTTDGLSCIYEENNEQFVIDTAPTTVEQMVDILVSYYNGDGKFKIKYKFTGEKESKAKEEEEKRNYKKWKQEFYQNRKKENIDEIRRVIIALLVIIALSILSYYWYTDELKFLMQKTEYSQAKIVNTQMRHIGRGYYLQYVTYEFDFKNKIYTGTYRAGKGLGKQEIGNFIKVKFSTSNPNRSKMIGNYKNN
jgi:hypothetical protein